MTMSCRLFLTELMYVGLNYVECVRIRHPTPTIDTLFAKPFILSVVNCLANLAKKLFLVTRYAHNVTITIMDALIIILHRKYVAVHTTLYHYRTNKFMMVNCIEKYTVTHWYTYSCCCLQVCSFVNQDFGYLRVAILTS